MQWHQLQKQPNKGEKTAITKESVPRSDKEITYYLAGRKMVYETFH
jgi:hypothetical protein